MAEGRIDLRREQSATLARPRHPYSPVARFFFWSMDLFTGPGVTLAKAKLLEMLACVPYRSWENRGYGRLTARYRERNLVREAERIVAWGREAQDNEYWHLLVLDEKMRSERLADPWYLAWPIPWLMVTGYRLMTWAVSRIDIRRAFLFNAEFEDHAEHVYARFVQEHPEWESQALPAELAGSSGAANWADLFRRIGLDERDHRNHSFLFAGRPESVVVYHGMPASPGGGA